MSLRSALIRLAHQKPELQEHLLPLLNKTAGNSWLKRWVLQSGLEADLKAQVVKYTGDARAAAKVEPMATGIEIRLWIPLEEGAPASDAQEIADLLLGPGAGLGPHTLVPGMYVANKILSRL